MTVACCYASGHIAFFPEVPASLEALPICEGPDGKVRDFISGVARHSYDGEHLLVPGIPEAGEDQDKAMDALFLFLEWISRKHPTGITVFGGRKKPVNPRNIASDPPTEKELAALRAVSRGECHRGYRPRGNTMHGPDISSVTLWRIANAGWVEDARGEFGRHVRLTLTQKGERVLNKAIPDRDEAADA